MVFEQVIVTPDPATMAMRAASHIAQQIRVNPASVIGFATGSTPERSYRQLESMKIHENLRFDQLTTFSLDEYYGICRDDPHSYHFYMHDRVFKPLGIPSANTHLLRGDTPFGEVEAHCREYEEQIKAAGGIGLQILGIGRNGHIGFNEPGTPPDSRTRLVRLTAESIEDNARFFAGEGDVPQMALTIGLETILESCEILLLASGRKKAWAIQAALEGNKTDKVPASILQDHGNVTVVVDHLAASKLVEYDKYRLEEQRHDRGAVVGI